MIVLRLPTRSVFGDTVSVGHTAAGGGGCVTVTAAVSVSVTTGPTGGVPVAVALFVKSAVTFASVHW